MSLNSLVSVNGCGPQSRGYKQISVLVKNNQHMLSGVWFDVLLNRLCCSLSPAPPLTVDNMKAVEGVKNREDFITYLGGIYSPNEEANLKDIMQQFILGEGRYQPSWRRVIYALDEANEIHVADQIRHYGEPVQGVCTCVCVCKFKMLCIYNYVYN